jgi:plastocyanin
MALAVASFAAFGCGGDDDGATSASQDANSAEYTTTKTTSAPNRLDLVTPPGDALIFKPDSATAEAGRVTVVWDNESDLVHSFCLEDAKGKDVSPGCSTPIKKSNSTASYELKPGKYTFYCDVDAHRAQGMEGTLTVE